MVHCADAEASVFATAGAMKDVDVGDTRVPLCIGRKLRLDFMVLRVAAARSDLLVLFQRFDVANREKGKNLLDRNALACLMVCH